MAALREITDAYKEQIMRFGLITIFRQSFISLFLFIFSCAALANIPTPKKPTKEIHHGVEIADDYSWLEKSDDPKVQKWTKQQSDQAEKFIAKIPFRKHILEKLTKWSSQTSPTYRRIEFTGNRFFAMKFQPPLEQPLIVTLQSIDDLNSEKIVLDLNKYDPSGNTSIDWFVPSHDGSLIAIAMSKKGSEIADLYIFDTASGKPLSDRILRVNAPTAGGSVAWAEGNKGFYYTRYPAAGERNEADRLFYQQVYYHQMGSPTEQDKYSVGKDFPRIAEIDLRSSDDGKIVVAIVANGDGGEFAMHLLTSGKEWQQISNFDHKIVECEIGKNKELFLLSRQNASRGKILRLPIDDRIDFKNPLKTAEEIVPEGVNTIQRFVVSKNFLFVKELVGGPSQLQVINLKTLKGRSVSTDPISSIWELVSMEGDRLAYQSESFVKPTSWFTLDANRDELQPQVSSLVVKSPVDFSDITVSREFATSKDGTKVPVNILTKKGLEKNGRHPTILTGYGGYGISLGPSFNVGLHLWLEQGGVWALANLRGGGEFGEDWHKMGMLTKKQNVFDDFAAAGKYLIDQKYTSTKHLGIEGGSNGGLLMGAMLTQHPEMLGAVVSHVGIYDMLKVETDANGSFNIPEFGTVKDKDQFKALHTYSPYHNVKKNGKYPPILFMTGVNDGRVNPYQSKKMTARLQELKGSSPVLLRINYGSGHGMGKKLSDRIAERADVYSFFFQQLKHEPKF